MPELPNLLRQRLAATENGETQAHPDADTLTAYMEQSLAAAESKTVVAHLAVCEPCREVVALSQAVMARAGHANRAYAGPGSPLAKAVYPGFWRGCRRCASHGGHRGYGASASAETSAAGFELARRRITRRIPAPQPAPETQQAQSSSRSEIKLHRQKRKLPHQAQQADTPQCQLARADLATSKRNRSKA